MKIETSCSSTQASATTWTAYDKETYDPAPDGDPLSLMFGIGTTEVGAVINLMEQLDEYWRREYDRLQERKDREIADLRRAA